MNAWLWLNLAIAFFTGSYLIIRGCAWLAVTLAEMDEINREDRR